MCKNPIFVPESDIIAFSLEEYPTLYFWNFKKKTTFTTMTIPGIIHDSVFTKPIDFSPDGMDVVYTNGYTAETAPTNQHIKNHIARRAFFPRYCLLSTYAANTEKLLPSDIIRLLIQQLRILYEL